jgi:hypothetical protein
MASLPQNRPKDLLDPFVTERIPYHPVGVIPITVIGYMEGIIDPGSKSMNFHVSHLKHVIYYHRIPSQ